ncbi:hypothetical protein [Nocardiopsis coralliicola]
MTVGSSRTTSAVALLGDFPSSGLLGKFQAERFPMRGDTWGERTDAFVDFVEAQHGQGRKVLALYPQWDADHAQRVIAFARGALSTDTIGAVGMELSPLALSLVSDQLAYLAPYLPAGVTAALAVELPRQVLSGAWLKRVNNLSNIPVTFKQHLGSLLPKTTFLAFNAPAKRVGRVKKGDPRPNLPGRPMDPVQVLVARPNEHSLDEFNEQLTPALRAVSLSALPEQPMGAKYWGVRKYIEFVVFSAHPQALPSAPGSIRPVTCPWCRELVEGVLCNFCGSVNERVVGRPPTRSADVPTPPNKRTGEHIRPAWVGAQSNRNASADGTRRPTGAAPPTSPEAPGGAHQPPAPAAPPGLHPPGRS